MFATSDAFPRLADSRHPRRGPRWKALARPSLLGFWMGRYSQRLVLGELDDHGLADIGKSREDVRRECSKWPWQA